MPTTTVSVTITTPAGLSIAELVGTLADYWEYPELVNGVPNPQTKAQFVKAQTARFLRESYIAAKAQLSADAARRAAVETAGQVTTD